MYVHVFQDAVTDLEGFRWFRQKPPFRIHSDKAIILPFEKYLIIVTVPFNKQYITHRNCYFHFQLKPRLTTSILE